MRGGWGRLLAVTAAVTALAGPADAQSDPDAPAEPTAAAPAKTPAPGGDASSQDRPENEPSVAPGATSEEPSQGAAPPAEQVTQEAPEVPVAPAEPAAPENDQPSADAPSAKPATEPEAPVPEAPSADAPLNPPAFPRPAEAPLFGEAPQLPPLPPEYLTREVEGMTLSFHPLARDRVRALAEEAPELRRLLSEELGHSVLGELTILVAVGPSDVARILPSGVPTDQESLALFEASTLVLALPSATADDAEVMASFRRGMAHLALDEAAGPDGLPRWLRTGYALRIAAHGEPERARALWWASVEERVIPLVDLDYYLEDGALDSVAAAESVDFVRYLSEGDRAEAFAHLMRGRRAGETFDAAMAQAYQADLGELEQAWRLELARHRTFVPVLLGSLGLWGLLALGAIFARRRRERAEPEVEEEEPEPMPPPRRRRRARRTPRIPVGAVEAAETEVPKVSHDGRWHTLH